MVCPRGPGGAAGPAVSAAAAAVGLGPAAVTVTGAAGGAGGLALALTGAGLPALAVAGAAGGLGALAAAHAGQAVGREELIHREADVLEQLAGVLGGGAAAAGAGAVLVGQAVVVHRHEQLAVPLQTDDGELAQGDKGAAVVVAHGQLAAEALAHAAGDLTDVAVAAAVLAALHQLRVQHDGIDCLHHRHRHVALLQHLAVQAVNAQLGGEDLGVALAAEEDDPLDRKSVV